MYKKKLIEVALPLEAINVASVREKSIRHGHPSTLHLWWARRPLAACRAVLFAQLVDDPSAHQDEFPTEKDQERERQRLFQIIEDLVLWENTNNETVLESARAEIRNSCGNDLPTVYDPFCGGGSIPLEAQRLGLTPIASDLNPIPVLIGKCLVQIPQSFSEVGPIAASGNPDLGFAHGNCSYGLSSDLVHYAEIIRERVHDKIGENYKDVQVTDGTGSRKTVVAWIWCRTVSSPHPACRGVHVPLAKSFWLSKRGGAREWVEPVIDREKLEYSFVVRHDGEPTVNGTVHRTSATCLISGQPITLDYIQNEGKAGRLGTRLMAVVAEGNPGRVYITAGPEEESLSKIAVPEDVPHCEIEHWRSCTNCVVYGMDTFEKLFTSRQLVCLTTFSNEIKNLYSQILKDCISHGMEDDNIPLKDDGRGARAYAEAITTYLSTALSRLADRSSSMCGWDTGYAKIRNTFGRQAIPMVWEFAEGNPFSNSTGNWMSCVEWIKKVILRSIPTPTGTIFQSDARKTTQKPASVVISTDPPYYDNIPYSNLSDFFYMWLRRTMQDVFPELFSTVRVPRTEELVANQFRLGGKDKAERFFETGMEDALSNISRVSKTEYPITIYYAFKQSEIKKEGVSSTGWATFLQSVISSGLMINGTWPLRTEMANRQMAIGTNALASSILLTCRHLPENASVTTRGDFIKDLRQSLPDALVQLQGANIAPVDMAQASIGPGMAIFTRYSKVLESDDTPMTVKTALQLINQALDEYLSEQEADYDADTRFAITWFETHGMERGPYGAAEILAIARGVAVTGVVESGILEARGGNVRLLSREEMLDDWDPATDKRLTIWECAQYLIRSLEKEGEAAAADLLSRLASRGEVARDLAYRLYGICERNSWAEEGQAYNGLVVAWPEIVRLAAQERPAGPAEPELEL
jgi:putative DNA methylase